MPEKYQGLTENMLNCVNAAKLNGTSRKLVCIIRNFDIRNLRSLLNQIRIFLLGYLLDFIGFQFEDLVLRASIKLPLNLPGGFHFLHLK